MDPIPALIARIDKNLLTRHLFHLSADPLPFRKLNYTRPGADRSSLHEADDFIAVQLESYGYTVEKEAVPVQALRTDRSRPMPHQFARPASTDPWYTADNLYAKKTGGAHPDEHLVVISHKDSQSWIDSPGAHDNAVGTVANLEIARLLSRYAAQRSIWFVFCNEEHVPWTSETVARNMADAGLNLAAALNIDSIGGKAADLSRLGRRANVTRYVTPEGEALADLMDRLNRRYGIGLEQGKFRSEQPNDDDGSFIKAGFPAAVLNIGSFPYADPDYHGRGDSPDKVDPDNLVMSTRLSLAFVVHLDRHGRENG